MKKVFSVIFSLLLTLTATAVSFPSEGYAPEGASYDNAGNLVSASGNDYLQTAYDDGDGIAEGEPFVMQIVGSDDVTYDVAVMPLSGYDFQIGDTFSSESYGISGQLSNTATFDDGDGNTVTINAPEGYLILVNNDGSLFTMGDIDAQGHFLDVIAFKLPLQTDVYALLFLASLAVAYGLSLRRGRKRNCGVVRS